MSTQIINCAHHTLVLNGFNLEQSNFIQMNRMSLLGILPFSKINFFKMNGKSVD